MEQIQIGLLTLVFFVVIGMPLIYAIRFFQKKLTQRRLNHFFEAVSLTDCVQTIEFKYNPKSGVHKYEAFVCFKDEPDTLYKIYFGPRSFGMATHITVQESCVEAVTSENAKYLKYDGMRYNFMKGTGYTKWH